MAAPYAISDTAFDTALNYLKNNCDKVVVLDADCGIGTAGYSNASTNNGTGSGMKLAEVASLTSSNFTLADRSGGGRKVTVDAATNVAVVAAGDASHIAWLDTSGTEVLFTTALTVARSGLTTSDTLDIPAHFAAILDAVVAS